MPLALLPFVFYNHMPRCGHPFAAPPDMITISDQTQTESTETNRKWCLWNNSVNNCQNWWRRAPFPEHSDVHSPPLQLDGPWTSVGPCGLFYNCLDWDVCDRSYNRRMSCRLWRLCWRPVPHRPHLHWNTTTHHTEHSGGNRERYTKIYE